MLGFIIDSRIEEDVNGERVRILVVACGGVEKGRGRSTEGDRRVSCSVRVSDKRIGNAFISPFLSFNRKEAAVELAS